MTTPRRYVRVRLRWHKGRLQATWGCVLCPRPSSQWFDPAYAHQRAGLHAAMCPAVVAATKRDQLRAELDALQVKYAAASQARDAWRRVANRNRAELDRMRADRDRLRDRLHQINPLNKDNDR